MNIFELLTVIGVIAAGYFCGKAFSLHYGLAGWVGGAILGGGLAIGAYCVFRRLLGITGKKR